MRAMSKYSARIECRVSVEQFEELKRAAAELNLPISELLRRGSLHYYRQRIAMSRAYANRQRREQNPQS